MSRKKQYSTVWKKIVVSCLCIFLVGVSTTNKVYALDLIEYSVLTEEEKEIMQSKEVYYVGYTNKYIPISYTVDGELTGIAVDVMNAIAEEMGITIEYVNLDGVGVDLSKLDISLQMNNFSDKPKSDVFVSYQSVLATKVNRAGDIEKVAIQKYFGLSEIDPMLEGKEFIACDDFASAKEVFDEGQADAFLMATLGFEKIAKELADGEYTLTVLETPVEFYFTYAPTFPEEKIDIINKQINSLDDVNVGLLVQKHSGYLSKTNGFWDKVAGNYEAIGVGFVAGMLCPIIIYMIWDIATSKKENRTIKGWA